MKIRLLLLSLASALTLSAAGTVPIFNAMLSMGRENRFVLVSAAGQTSQFLKLGEVFDDYLLKSYDAKTATLDLEREGKITRVTLVTDAAVANAPAAPVKATLADATALLNKMHFEQLIERSLERQKKTMASMAEQMSARMNMPGVDKTEVAAFQKKIMDEVMNTIDPSQLKTDMAKIYSDTFTQDELVGLSSFYDTSLGQALLEKQQTVQEKLAATMQPRMMAVMPKIQQMAKDFAMEQKAKREAAAAQSAGAPAPIAAPKP